MRIVRGILIGTDALDAHVRLASAADLAGLTAEADRNVVLAQGVGVSTMTDWQNEMKQEHGLYLMTPKGFVMCGHIREFTVTRNVEEYGGVSFPGVARLTGTFIGVVQP